MSSERKSSQATLLDTDQQFAEIATENSFQDRLQAAFDTEFESIIGANYDLSPLEQQRYNNHTQQLFANAEIEIDDADRDMLIASVTYALKQGGDVDAKADNLSHVIDAYKATRPAPEQSETPQSTAEAAEDDPIRLRDIVADVKAAGQRYENDHTGRFARTRNVMGRVATMSMAGFAGGFGYAQERAEHLKNHSQRNKIKYAAGTLGVMGAGVAVALIARHYNIAFDSMNSNASASAMDVMQMPQTHEFIPTVDTRILVGGRLDGQGNGIDHVASQLSELNASNTVKVQYPAEIAPLDKTSYDASNAIAAQKAYDAYHAANGQSVEFVGYSQGTRGVQEAANRIIAENDGVKPDNLKVTLIATPDAAVTGVFESEYAQAIDPVLDMAGIDTDSEIPQGATVIAMDTDFWANSGDKPVTTMISQAIGLAGDGHRAPADGMKFTETVVDGVTYRTYTHEGTQTAALRVAEQHGFLVTKQADAFGQAIAPQGEVGVAGTEIDAGEALRTGGDLAQDSLVRAGVDPDHSKAVGDMVRAVPEEIAQPLVDAAQQIPEQIAGAVAGNTVGSQGGFQEVISDVTEQWTQPIPAPAPAPAPAPVAPPPVQEMVRPHAPVVNDVAEQVKKAAPQLGAQVDQLTGFLGIRR